MVPLDVDSGLVFCIPPQTVCHLSDCLYRPLNLTIRGVLSSSCESNLCLHAEHISDLLHGPECLSGCPLAVSLDDASVPGRILQSKSDDLL